MARPERFERVSTFGEQRTILLNHGCSFSLLTRIFREFKETSI